MKIRIKKAEHFPIDSEKATGKTVDTYKKFSI